MVQAITISNDNITLYKITALFKLDNLKLCIHITYMYVSEYLALLVANEMTRFVCPNLHFYFCHQTNSNAI